MENIVSKELQTPIEIALGVDADGMTTAKKLYDFLELNPKNYSHWCKRNIVENEFATENEDYWAFVVKDERDFNPKPTTDYKLTAHFAKKLSVKGNSARAEEAREYFTQLEEKAKQHVIDRTQLSPQTQLMLTMSEAIARTELEQKRQSEQLNRLENNQKALTDTFQHQTAKAFSSGQINACQRLRKAPSLISRKAGRRIMCMPKMKAMLGSSGSGTVIWMTAWLEPRGARWKIIQESPKHSLTPLINSRLFLMIRAYGQCMRRL